MLIVSLYLSAWYLLRMGAVQFEIERDVTIWTPQVALDFVLLLVFGLRYAPALFLARLLDQYLFVPRDWPLTFTLLYGTIYAAVYAGAAAVLLQRVKIEPRLRSLRDVAWFAGLAGFIAPLVSAVLQNVLMIQYGYIERDGFINRTLHGWAGDATGIMMLGPTLLIAMRYLPRLWAYPERAGRPLGDPPLQWPGRLPALRAAAEFAVVGVAAWVTFAAPRGGTLDYTYVAFLPLIWIAVKHSLAHVAVGVTIVNVVAAWLVHPQVQIDSSKNIALQFGLMALSHAGVLLGALVGERRRMMEERLEAERRANVAQRFEAVGRLAGGVAHDFNNLLTGIGGYIHLAIAELPGNSEARTLLDEADSGVEQATDLTRQLLAFAGKGKGAQPTDLNALLTQTVRFLRGQIPGGIAVHVRCAPDLPPVEVDPSRLRQVVLNLVLNAAEAIGDTGKGSITVATGILTVADQNELQGPDGLSLPAGSYVCLEVADTGCGMDAATVKQIFEPFFTTKQSGHGLGLGAVAGAVRAYGGTLRVNSTVGQGTTFTVLLPVAATSTPEKPSTWGASMMMEPAVHPGGSSVLVVDDDASMRLLLEQLFERWNWHALVADSGAEGVRLFSSHADQIGCVLADLRMPGMDGLTMCHHVRQISPTVPLILMSSTFGERFDSDLARLGVQSTVVKPFELAELHEQVRHALQLAAQS